MSPSPKWYLHRLAAMTPPEIGYRLRQHLRTETERYLGMLYNRGFNRRDHGIDEGYQIFQDEGVPFFFRWRDREALDRTLSERFKDGLAATRRKADNACKHRFEIFKNRFQYEQSQVNWHRDPRSSLQWPLRFWADINTRDGEALGGVKWVWELNRHHHLVALGKAYFLSGEDRYAEEVCAQLVDWIQTNPPRIGVNWTSPLELAIRLINWTWALAFMRHSPALTMGRFVIIQRSVADQADHISLHLSAYSSANNHLIGEAAGLAIVGLSFPWLRHAGRWRDMGLKILARELERQIYPDGVPAEQAIHYLTFILDFSVLVWRLAELSGWPVPQVWHDRLGAACNFILHVMDEKGSVPSIGDSDDGCVVQLNDSVEANNYRSILATAAVILKRPELKVLAGPWDEKSHWLLGVSGMAAYNSLSMYVPNVSSHAFREGGYCVMRAPGRVIVFDCGPLGYLSTAAHGHADALSLTVSLHDQPLLIDPGTYAYQEDGKWRDYFRSTAAHNTVVVDGCNQGQITGTFLWGRRASAQLLQWKSTPDYDLAIAEHDGYSHLGVIHTRTVLFVKPDWCLIVDHLCGRQDHHLEQLWHLPTDGEIEIGIERARLTVGNVHTTIMPVDMPGAEAKVQCGEEAPTQGWHSSYYGWRKPAPVLIFSGRVHMPARWVTALHLAPPSSNSTIYKDHLLDILAGLATR